MIFAKRPVSLSDRFCFSSDRLKHSSTTEAALAQKFLFYWFSFSCCRAHLARGTKSKGPAADSAAHEQVLDAAFARCAGSAKWLRCRDGCKPKWALRRNSQRRLWYAEKPGAPVHRNSRSEYQ